MRAIKITCTSCVGQRGATITPQREQEFMDIKCFSLYAVEREKLLLYLYTAVKPAACERDSERV